ncbi:hypothetical protein D3C86_1393630 [compost metagenome]
MLPDMAGHDLDAALAPGALCLRGASGALAGFGGVFPVADAVGGAIGKELPVRANIPVTLAIVDVFTFVEIAVLVIRTAVANHAVNAAFDQALANVRREIPGIESGHRGIEAEALAHAVQPPEIRTAVMHVRWRDVRVGDERMHAVDGAVVEVKEAGRFAVAHHVAGVRIDRADLGFLLCRRVVIVMGRQRLLAVRLAVRIDCGVQFGQVMQRLFIDLMQIVFVLVGRCLQMRAVAVEHPTANQAMLDCLFDDLIENHLLNVCPGEAAAPVL